MRFKRQVHTLTVPWPSGLLMESDLTQVEAGFEAAYQAQYGRGTTYREAGIEVTAFRLEAIGFAPKPGLAKYVRNLRVPPSDACKGKRPVLFQTLTNILIRLFRWGLFVFGECCAKPVHY